MARAGFLRGFGAKATDSLLGRSRFTLLATGSVLWRESDPASDLGVVISGRLKLTRQAHGVEMILDVAVVGDVLGEEAFALGGAYQSDPHALRRCEVLLVPYSAVREMLAVQSGSAQALAEDLAAQLIRIYRVTEDLGIGGVEQRLARVLLRLADRLGEPFLGGIYIGLKLTGRDLAAMSATTSESVSRHISEWERRGILTHQPAGYLVHNIEQLRHVAESDEKAVPQRIRASPPPAPSPPPSGGVVPCRLGRGRRASV